MPRPSIKELCGLDTSSLIGLPIEIASMEIIDALQKERDNVAIKLNEVQLDANCGYEETCRANTKLIYLERAINSRKQDYEEMMYFEEEKSKKNSSCVILDIVKNLFRKGECSE